MANTDAPFGFKPVRKINGAWLGETNPYPIASAYGTSIYRGDPVGALADGTIGRAAAGSQARGVFWGVEYVDSTGEVKFQSYWTASTATLNSVAATAYVIDDPFVVFEIQNDSDTNTPADTDINGNMDWIFTHAGSAATGSKCELDTSSLTPSTTAGCRILRRKPGSEAGAYAVYEVLIQEHDFRSTTGV